MRMWIELTAGDRVSQRIRSGLGVIGGMLTPHLSAHVIQEETLHVAVVEDGVF